MCVEEETGRVDISITRLYSEVKKGYTPFMDGDIIFAKITPCMENGKIAILRGLRNGVGFGSTEFHVLRVRDNVCKEFIFYHLMNKDFREKAQSYMRGSAGQQRVPSDFLDQTIMLLPPLSEQQKIASILSKVDNLIQKTEEIIEQTQRLKKGLMQRLLTQGIGHTKFKKIVLFPQYIHMIIPEEWNVVTFGDIAVRITYGFTNPMSRAKEGPWLITAKDVKDGKINYQTAEKTAQKDYNELLTGKSRPKIGTVLITKDGTLGEVAIVDRNNICINQSVASIEPKSSILPEFLALTLQSHYIKKVIDTFSPATTIQHISITDLAKWKFGLPPINEQQRIITILSYTDRYTQQIRNHKALVQDLKKGLMQKLLAGKIRVKV